jgi:hypothetical protein
MPYWCGSARCLRRGRPALRRGRDAQIGAASGPGSGQIGMGQRLALVPIGEDDVAGFALGLAQLEAQPNACDLGCDLAAFQPVPGAPEAEVFLQCLRSLRPVPRAGARQQLAPPRSSPAAGRARCLPAAPRPRRGQNRYVTAGLCPLALRTLPRSAGSFSPTSSAAQLAPDPPRPDHGTPPTPSVPRAPPPRQKSETCPKCRTPRITRPTESHSRFVGQARRIC